MKPFGILSLSGVLTLGLLVAAVNDAYAGAGDLDPSFGAGGQVETNFGRTVIPSAALLQPDGKIHRHVNRRRGNDAGALSRRRQS